MTFWLPGFPHSSPVQCSESIQEARTPWQGGSVSAEIVRRLFQPGFNPGGGLGPRLGVREERDARMACREVVTLYKTSEILSESVGATRTMWPPPFDFCWQAVEMMTWQEDY